MTNACVVKQICKYVALLAACAIVLESGCSADYVVAPTPTPHLVGLQIHYQNPHQYANTDASVFFRALSIDSEGVMADVTAQTSWSSESTIVTLANGRARVVGTRDGEADV